MGETRQEHLAPSEVENCLGAFASLLKEGILVPIVYTGPRPSETPMPAMTVAGSPKVSILTPRDEDASQQNPCAELCTRLGLLQGGRALLIVRPDGYIAILHHGNWEAVPVLEAMSELS